MLVKEKTNEIVKLDHRDDDQFFYLASKAEGADWNSMDVFNPGEIGENHEYIPITPEDLLKRGYKCVCKCKVIESTNRIAMREDEH